MWALVDCNSFFCSCEKVFHPGLQGRPVCVLSSNDGIIVALTPEAKAVGLHRGDAIFKVRDIVEKRGVKVFSTNMYLYSAMSKRIVSILRGSCDRVENYSIDESFLDLRGYERHFNLEEYMRGIADRVRLWTDVPVSVGVAPTKTLAKMGSKFAKNYRGYHSVFVIDTDEKRRKALSLFDLEDVWGVGRRTYEKLLSLGVTTPLQFADKPEEWVRRHFTKPGFRYKRSGVVLSEISPDRNIQLDIFDPVRGREERKVLSEAIDCMNHKFGLKTVRLAVEDGESDHWKSKSEHRSPNYLTDIDEILTVQI